MPDTAGVYLGGGDASRLGDALNASESGQWARRALDRAEGDPPRNNTYLGLVTQLGGNSTVVLVGTTIVSATWSAGVATITTAGPHGLYVGDVIDVENVLDSSGNALSGFDGQTTVASVPTDTTFTFALASDPGGVGVFGSVSLVPVTIDAATWSAGVATITSPLHGLSVGQAIQVTSLPYGWGTNVIASSVPDENTFTYALPNNPGFFTSGSFFVARLGPLQVQIIASAEAPNGAYQLVDAGWTEICYVMPGVILGQTAILVGYWVVLVRDSVGGPLIITSVLTNESIIYVYYPQALGIQFITNSLQLGDSGFTDTTTSNVGGALLPNARFDTNGLVSGGGSEGVSNQLWQGPKRIAVTPYASDTAGTTLPSAVFDTNTDPGGYGNNNGIFDGPMNGPGWLVTANTLASDNQYGLAAYAFGANFPYGVGLGGPVGVIYHRFFDVRQTGTVWESETNFGTPGGPGGLALIVDGPNAELSLYSTSTVSPITRYCIEENLAAGVARVRGIYATPYVLVGGVKYYLQTDQDTVYSGDPACQIAFAGGVAINAAGGGTSGSGGGGGGGGPVTRNNLGGAGSGVGTGTRTATLSATVPKGAKLIVLPGAVALGVPPSVLSVKFGSFNLTKESTVSSTDSLTSPTAEYRTDVWSLTTGSAMTGTITVTLSLGSGDTGDVQFLALYVQNLPHNAADGHNHGSGNNTSPDTGSVTPTTTSDYFQAVCMNFVGGGHPWSGTPNTFNAAQQRTTSIDGVNWTLTEAYLIPGTGVAEDATMTLSPNPDSWVALLQAFK